jgi:hypothetical protein
MVPLLFFVFIFAATLLQPMASVTSYTDVRLSVPHLYEATFVASLSLIACSFVCLYVPTSLWWILVILLLLSVLGIRWQLYVDDKQWMNWATMEQSKVLLYGTAAMNRTQVDRVKAMAHRQVTDAESTLRLLRFQGKVTTEGKTEEKADDTKPKK